MDDDYTIKDAWENGDVIFFILVMSILCYLLWHAMTEQSYQSIQTIQIIQINIINKI